MRYYLDTEFDGLGGNLLSLALVPADGGEELYLAWPRNDCCDWVTLHVIPIITTQGAFPLAANPDMWPGEIEAYFKRTFDGYPIEVIADWPDDVGYLSRLLITGPGKMVDIPGIVFRVARVDAYPTNLPHAVQHNALWDARALRYRILGR